MKKPILNDKERKQFYEFIRRIEKSLDIEAKQQGGECYNCGGKGYNTVFSGVRISPDFEGDIGKEIKPKINKVPCKICKGTSIAPTDPVKEHEIGEHGAIGWDTPEGAVCVECGEDIIPTPPELGNRV